MPTGKRRGDGLNTGAFMDERNSEVSQSGSTEAKEGYEAPAIETVVSKDDLEREVQYAGAIVSPGA